MDVLGPSDLDNLAARNRGKGVVLLADDGGCEVCLRAMDDPREDDVRTIRMVVDRCLLAPCQEPEARSLHAIGAGLELRSGVYPSLLEVALQHSAARQSGCEDGVNLDEKVSPDA
jgi:hypothetical protein